METWFQTICLEHSCWIAIVTCTKRLMIIKIDISSFITEWQFYFPCNLVFCFYQIWFLLEIEFILSWEFLQKKQKYIPRIIIIEFFIFTIADLNSSLAEYTRSIGWSFLCLELNGPSCSFLFQGGFADRFSIGSAGS